MNKKCSIFNVNKGMKILAGKHDEDKINVGQLLRRINKRCAV